MTRSKKLSGGKAPPPQFRPPPGRVAASIGSIPMQNIPVRSELGKSIRRRFNPPPNALHDADYAAIEQQLAARMPAARRFRLTFDATLRGVHEGERRVSAIRSAGSREAAIASLDADYDHIDNVIVEELRDP